MKQQALQSLFALGYTLLLAGCMTASSDDARPSYVASHENPADTAVAVSKSREDAISIIHEACNESFDIISEERPSMEGGIALTLSQEHKVNWYIRYRCH